MIIRLYPACGCNASRSTLLPDSQIVRELGGFANLRKAHSRKFEEAKLLSMASRGKMIPRDRHGSLVETTREFADRLDGLYGLYLDAITGFKHNVAKVKESQ